MEKNTKYWKDDDLLWHSLLIITVGRILGGRTAHPDPQRSLYPLLLGSFYTMAMRQRFNDLAGPTSPRTRNTETNTLAGRRGAETSSRSTAQKSWFERERRRNDRPQERIFFVKHPRIDYFRECLQIFILSRNISSMNLNWENGKICSFIYIKSW